MTVTTERLLDDFRETPPMQAEAPPDSICLCNAVDSLEWAERLDALVSDFALAIVNGEARYLENIDDLWAGWVRSEA